MDSLDLESLRAGMEQLAEAARGAAEALNKAFVELTKNLELSAEAAKNNIEEALRFLQEMEIAAEKIKGRNRDRKRFQRCERAENARRAARFKQYNRAAVVVRKRTRPRSREFKPP